MTLLEIRKRVESCASQMNDRYGAVVFDEWAVVSIEQQRAQVLWYDGPRNDQFLASFVSDLGALRAELLNGRYSAGDFEFTRNATGTLFEAFIMLRGGLYLICNNTRSSMNEITRNPRWLHAQVPFAELADGLRADPFADAA